MAFLARTDAKSGIQFVHRVEKMSFHSHMKTSEATEGESKSDTHPKPMTMAQKATIWIPRWAGNHSLLMNMRP